MQREWESVSHQGGDSPGPVSSLDRIEVEGGWLYKVTELYTARTAGGAEAKLIAVALTFVPR